MLEVVTKRPERSERIPQSFSRMSFVVVVFIEDHINQDPHDDVTVLYLSQEVLKYK